MPNARVLPVLLLALLAEVLSAQSQTVVIPPARDATLYQDGLGRLANGAGPSFFVGLNALGGRRRAVLAFDFAANLPVGARIDQVALVLRMDRTQGGALPVSLHRLTAAFGEGSSVPIGAGGMGANPTAGDPTWIRSFHPSVSWATPGGDFEANASDLLLVSGPAVYTFAGQGLVQDVQDWVDGARPNHGWLLKAPETTPGNAKRFVSKEAFDPLQRPYLQVTYRVATVQVAATGCGGLAAMPVGLPSLGNAQFALRFGGATPGSPVFLFFATQAQANSLYLPGGCYCHLEPMSALTAVVEGASPMGPVMMDGMGEALLPLPIPAIPGLAGMSAAVQGLVPGANWLASDALVLTLQ